MKTGRDTFQQFAAAVVVGVLDALVILVSAIVLTTLVRPPTTSAEKVKFTGVFLVTFTATVVLIFLIHWLIIER